MAEPRITRIQAGDIADWDRADDWLVMVGDLLQETSTECHGEPALGMWAVTEDDRVIGVVGIRRRRTNGRLELCRLHVRPEHRGRGLSKRLIGDALAHAHAHSPEHVTAQVRQGNAPAETALARCRFVEVSRSTREHDGATILLLEELGPEIAG